MDTISRSSVMASTPPQRGVALEDQAYRPLAQAASLFHHVLPIAPNQDGAYVKVGGHTESRVLVKVISWNVLRLTGAAAEDVAALIHRHRPDLALLQEATQDISELPKLVGGTFFRHPLEGLRYGLAKRRPHALPRPRALRLPVSQGPGRVPPRLAPI